MLLLVPDSGDHVGDRGRAREGDRLDRQLPLDADHPIRVPDRQATPLYRGLDDRLLRPVADRDFHFPRAAEGAVPRPYLWNARLCHCDRWVRRADLVLHPNPGRRRLRNRDPLDRAGGQFLRNARAGLLALGRGEDHRPVVPLVLVPAGFGRRVRQGARDRRASGRTSPRSR